MSIHQKLTESWMSPYPCQSAQAVLRTQSEMLQDSRRGASSHIAAAAPRTRREMLCQAGGGLGGIALAALLRERAFGLEPESVVGEPGMVTGNHAARGLHHRPRAKRVIFLYMDGGPSQVDTFDPKPLLDRFHGEDPSRFFAVEPTQFNNNGKVLASPWKFRQYGQSGLPISDLFPHIATCADELAVVRSLVSEFPEHTFANYFLHTGSGLQGRPSMGA